MNKNESVAFMLAIIEIILIGLMFTTENEWVVGFGLVAANFLGLTLFLGVKTIGVAFLLVSLIAAGYYVIKNAHKWWK
jgi:membrane protein implicated in regulation of membrane protease activity